ncbi:hypothetical protein J2T02_003962 [Chitinophaga terrae (ex Kim and Jung 2007)]|uniref:hypothetical protein n=1 Tax=Chitinophaga terrae (ex Kim and Jung 2007) TaxID=408074 RepID=UPI0027834BA4|nr:hypothetical protein [Chitinophaga terrae (ex Kim and Jung 2007)]MDQ0108822.1 hypothetical protein [Chitinophaga terrae (ex Kim and Jung 2007)]
MKKNVKPITSFFAIVVLFVGVNLSISSYGISLKQMIALTISDTGTGTGTGTDGGEKDHMVMVSGQDCSWKDPVYDRDNGTIVGYYIYTAVKATCEPGEKSCKLSDQIPCSVTDVKYEPKKN